MRYTACIVVLALPLAALARRSDRDWKIDEKESLHQSFNVTAGSGGKKLLVDNIHGYVHITGSSGGEVRVNIDKHIFADSQEAVAEAKRDVKMDMSQQGNFVRLYEDGPFRTHDGTNYRGEDYYGYRVVFNFEIEVPADTELIVKTLNNDIVVKKTAGDYEIHGLNGSIDMEDVAGAGSVGTLNGKVKVAYSRNPSKATVIKTLNGTVDVYFQNPLNADLDFKRLNGGIYTDFELTARPANGSSSQSGGKWIYRSDHGIAGRAGTGGPQLSFETLNGSIRLHTKTL
ncbi:MAG TPA: hypothetical protein VMH28_24530 [Candidatus Acidoferrales bacterium]|nr:hypothetical protein [Candidatus Acidoferrales bacterium]